MKGKTLQEIASLVGGDVVGDSSILICGATNIEEAGSAQITFAVPPHIEKAAKSQAAAVIIPKNIEFPVGKPLIIVENPRAAFALLLELFSPPINVKREIHNSAIVPKSATIGKNVAILPYAVLGENVVIGDNSIIYPHTYIADNCHIGKNCIIYSSVSIYAACEIGDNVTVHSGTVIGGDGFGYVTIGREHKKVPQVGNVIIADNVEIGCNTCIDCATTGSTIIGKGTKIDNLVHIGHNDVIGENCFLIAFVGLPGSVKVGNNVTFAGQAAAVGHINIGDNCVFAGRAGVTADVPSNSVYAGFPARPHKEWLKQEAVLRKVPDMLKKITELEKLVKKLQDEK